MKVLTLNTWQKSGPWQERWRVVVEGMRHYQPDVIAFQEVFDADWRDTIANRAGYPYRAVPAPTASGLVLLSRVPIFASELYVLSTRSPFENYNRYLLWAEIAWQGGALHLFNVHLSWQPQDQVTRRAQVREACRHVSEKRGAARLLMGDLNATPDSEEIRWLLSESKFVDTFAAMNPSHAGITWDRRNPFTCEQKPATPDRRIDYILAAGDPLVSSLLSCRVVFNEPDANGIFASDHYGVLAEFSF
jgi:endonuclease/exonuclease/phosphatase family metal-dependent hydrolase